MIIYRKVTLNLRESHTGTFCEITCQVNGQNDIPDKLFEILRKGFI